MRIHAEELASGDVLQMHDWQLHVVTVDYDTATAVGTAEFDFPLHFAAGDVVDVLSASGTRRVAAADLDAAVNL